MALAKAFAPKCVGCPFRQNGFAEQPINGKQTGIPTHGNQRDFTAGTRLFIDGGKIFGDTRMGVEAVDGAKTTSQCGALLGQIVAGAATQDKHINGADEGFDPVQGMHWYGRISQRDGFWVTSCKYANEPHVGVLRDRGLDATTQVAISHNTDSDF